MSKNNNPDDLLNDITCEVLEDHNRPMDPSPVEVWINSTDNTAVLWLGRDGRLYSRYGFVGEGASGGGGEIPLDVMVKSVYDKNDNGIVDLAEGLTPNATVKWEQITGVPSGGFDVNWDDIIGIPGDIVYQPELNLAIKDVDAKFLVMEGLILERVSRTELEASIKEVTTDINSSTENKETFYAVVDKYVKSREGSEVSIDPEYDKVVDTWYGNGQPSLSTFPTDSWDDASRPTHVGDFYYDKLTEFTYVFVYDRTAKLYSWKRVNYDDLTDVLKIASKNRDTEDGRRQVFRSADRVDIPFKVGDLWMPADKRLMVAAYGADGIDPKDDQRWIPVTTYSPSELEEMLDQAMSDISAIYDSSNVLDTSFLYNYPLDTPIRNSDMWIYKHYPRISPGTATNATMITANEDMWGTNSHLLRLSTDPSATGSNDLKQGVIFGKSDDQDTLVKLDPTKRYRFSVWININQLESMSLKIEDYSHDGILNTSNTVNQTRPINFSRLGTSRWGLAVTYITPYGSDLAITDYNSQVLDRAGIQFTVPDDDLKPMLFVEGNLVLRLSSNTSSQTSAMSTMNYRMDVVDDKDIRFPSIQEILDNRVKRSGVIEELRSKVNTVERKTTPEAIVETITSSEAFRSAIPTMTTVDKSNLIVPTKIKRTDSESGVTSILNELNYSISQDVPDLELVIKSPKSCTTMSSIATTTDLILIEATRSGIKVPSLIGFSLTTEADIQSTDESIVKSRVVTLKGRKYFDPEVVVENSYIDSNDSFVPGRVTSTVNHPEMLLSSVTYIIPNSNTVTVNYSYYLDLTITTAGKLSTSRVSYNFAPVNSEGDITLLNLVAPSGTAMVANSNGIVSPTSLLIQSYVANTQVESWSIKVGDSSQWRDLDPSKFTTGDYGILMSTHYDSEMGESDNDSRIRSITITINIRRLTDEMLEDPDWDDSVTPPDMSNTTSWTFRALSSEGVYSYMTITYGLDVVDEITRISEQSYELTRTVEGMTGIITEIVTNVDGLSNTIDKYEAYHRFDMNGLSMGKSINGIVEAEIFLSPNAVEMKAYTDSSSAYVPGPNVVAYIAQGVLGVDRMRTRQVSFDHYEVSEVGTKNGPVLAIRPGLSNN